MGCPHDNIWDHCFTVWQVVTSWEVWADKASKLDSTLQMLEVEAMTIFASTLQEKDRKVDNSCRRHEGVLAALQHALIWHQFFREFIFIWRINPGASLVTLIGGQGFQAPKSFNMDPIQVLCKVLQTFRLLAQFLDNRYVTKGEELRLTVRCLDPK